MVYENPVALLRTLKGCPLSVLMALAIAGQPVGRSWLTQVTGYTSTTTVQQALEYLAEIGMARRSRYRDGWMLAGNAKQLPLVFPELSEPDDPAVDKSAELGKSQNLTLPVSATTATTCYSRAERLEEAEAEQESIIDSSRFQRNIESLHEVGIMGKTAERLARLEHMNGKYIAYLADHSKKRGDSTGLLVRRFEDGDPLPVHDRGCTCELCTGRGYDADGFEIFDGG